ncbi:BrnA antitoxin family protein [Craurococcus roseus]|uniref:BrnA antitoxin family protein n=1 Tax=Craurococcus roseus TaxID=77585 RepID=A0ABP3QQK9_9PROT
MKPKLRAPTPEEEEAIQRGIAADPDNPEWTGADFAAALPAAEVVPAVAAAHARRRARGPQKAPTKRLVSIRLDRDVLDALQASGRGWQVRVNEIVRRAVLGDKG